MRLVGTIKNSKVAVEFKGIASWNGSKQDAAELLLDSEMSISHMGTNRAHLFIQDSPEPMVVVWDYKEDPTKLIMGALNKFGIYSYKVPSICGTDHLGIIISENELTDEQVIQFDKENQTSEIITGG